MLKRIIYAEYNSETITERSTDKQRRGRQIRVLSSVGMLQVYVHRSMFNEAAFFYAEKCLPMKR